MCLHLNNLINQHEGCTVCTDCGLVLDVYFEQQEDWSKKSSNNSNSRIKTYLKDCCDRMHIPNAIVDAISKRYSCFRKVSEFSKISDIYHEIGSSTFC